MLMADERAWIIDCCHRMVRDRLTVGTSGNVSVRAGNLVAITPSGVPYESLRPAEVPVVDLAGSLVEGRGPSTEVPLHLTIYAHSEAAAVVHTHPVWATVVGTLVDEVPIVHYMLAPCGGAVRVAPYARFGTPELAENVRVAMAGRRGVLLRNHGAVTWGDTLGAAYEASIQLEWVCGVWARARAIGNPALLSAEELQAVVAELGAGRHG